MKRRAFLTVFMTTAFGFGTRMIAQDTANVPVRPNIPEIAEDNVKQLLLLMDTDKNGKISKAEWMKFMSEEFDRLDTDKSGELSKTELLNSRIVIKHVSPETLGK